MTHGFNSRQHLGSLVFLWQLAFPERAKFKADQWTVGKWKEEIT